MQIQICTPSTSCSSRASIPTGAAGQQIRLYGPAVRAQSKLSLTSLYRLSGRRRRRRRPAGLRRDGTTPAATSAGTGQGKDAYIDSSGQRSTRLSALAYVDLILPGTQCTRLPPL